MNEYDATEQAYKNGYEQGMKDVLDNLVFCKECMSHSDISCPPGSVWCKRTDRYMKEIDFCSRAERRKQ